eukprot:scaffold655_cov225-Pinguiococcus_pyrenoidosus.AAC.22
MSCRLAISPFCAMAARSRRVAVSRSCSCTPFCLCCQRTFQSSNSFVVCAIASRVARCRSRSSVSAVLFCVSAS